MVVKSTEMVSFSWFTRDGQAEFGFLGAEDETNAKRMIADQALQREGGERGLIS